jgi:GT2 family glycosyltransferase
MSDRLSLAEIFSPSSVLDPENMVDSAWLEHGPFALFLMEALRPKVFVELGTHNGFSYFCFCESAKQFDIGTRCYAVDTWKGDQFAGYYGEEVFNSVQEMNQKYSEFSQLFRMTFDDALNHFPDGSIDLLHIDGSHLYEEVKHDFESWRRKLTGCAIVLFHDTNVREQSFGVWRLFEELKADHPTFEFKHGYGLGVLALGEIPLVLAHFFNADAKHTDLIRLIYARLGAHISRAWLGQRELRAIGETLERTKTELAGTAAKLASERAARQGTGAKAQQVQQQFMNERIRYTEELLALRNEMAQLQQSVQQRKQQSLIDERNLVALRNELAQLQQSTFWRATGPIRAGLNKVPTPLRDTLRRGAKAVYWAVTSHRMPARVAWLRARQREAISRDPEPLALAEDRDLALVEDRDASPPLDAKAQVAAQAKAELADFLASGARLAFFDGEAPDISALIILWNQAHLTLRCLRALEKECKIAGAPSLEIVLVDNASSDETSELLSRLDGARIIRKMENVGFVRACNQAAAIARGPTLLFLNNDAFVRLGALSAAHVALKRSPDVGAVGGRLIMPSGLLQEAGCIVWSDGSTSGYGRGLAADAGEAMFRRDVDYCSGAFLLTPRVLWEKLGGFDESYAPAYYEEADYCMRVWEVGLRVVYEPAAAVDHYEFGSSNYDEIVATALLNRKRFRARHAEVLHHSHLPAAPANVLAARSHRDPGRRRLLVLDNEVPLRALGGGCPRMRETLVEAAAAGWLVSFYPLQNPKVDWAAARADLSCEIEILSDRGAADLGKFLEERRGYYDLVLVSRPDNMALVRAALRERPYLICGARLIYDAEALFAARIIAEATLEGRPLPTEEVDRIINDEISLAEGADGIVCVTEAEAKAFRNRHLAPVYILGYSTEPRFDAPGFEGRHGFLFVLEQQAPNWRGLKWFVREVWPLIRSKLPDATMIVAGHLHPNYSELETCGVRLVGPVADLHSLYNAARVFVAPIQFAAGVPIKIVEATAAGLPTAATSLMARQLGWAPSVEIAAEDEPMALAAAAVTLHEESSAWSAVRAAAQQRIAREYSAEAFRSRLRELLDGRLLFQSDGSQALR